MIGEPLLYIRDLTAPLPAPDWPAGTYRVPFNDGSAPAAHGLLEAGYRNGFGAVESISDWYAALVADAEYDPDLCFLYFNENGPAGFAQVWTSGFIKDLVVAESCRRTGIGRALMLTVFAELKSRAFDEARLKVVVGNTAAFGLYHALGMVPVA